MTNTKKIEGQGFTMDEATTAIDVKRQNTSPDVYEHGELDETESQFYVSIDRWNHYKNSTDAIIKYAEEMMRKAEKTIQQQQERLSQLEELVTTDELTQINNRRGFNEAFGTELERINRGQSQGGVLVLIDLDDFKPINDTYGHLAGDECLKLIAATLQSETRSVDTVARLGGDEFAILFTNTSITQLYDRTEDIIWQLNNLTLDWYEQKIEIKASVGIKEFKAGADSKKVFDAADLALYEQKTDKDKLDAFSGIKASPSNVVEYITEVDANIA